MKKPAVKKVSVRRKNEDTDPITVGDLAKDIVTNFKGVVVCRTEWLNGCVRLGLQPKELTKEGKPIDMHVFDEQQVQLVKRIAPPQAPTSRALTGGPHDAPSRNTDPSR